MNRLSRWPHPVASFARGGPPHWGARLCRLRHHHDATGPGPGHSDSAGRTEPCDRARRPARTRRDAPTPDAETASLRAETSGGRRGAGTRHRHKHCQRYQGVDSYAHAHQDRRRSASRSASAGPLWPRHRGPCRQGPRHRTRRHHRCSRPAQRGRSIRSGDAIPTVPGVGVAVPAPAISGTAPAGSAAEPDDATAGASLIRSDQPSIGRHEQGGQEFGCDDERALVPYRRPADRADQFGDHGLGPAEVAEGAHEVRRLVAGPIEPRADEIRLCPAGRASHRHDETPTAAACRRCPSRTSSCRGSSGRARSRRPSPRPCRPASTPGP